MILIIRTLFAAVILFELLNGFGVLHVPLDFSWFGLTVTTVVAWGAVEMLFGKWGNTRTLRLALSVALVGVLLDAAGDVFRLYSRIIWYDRALHVIGGALVAYLVYLLFDRVIATLRPTMRALFIVGVANLLGVLYEIEEWLEDAWVHKRQLRLGDGPDVADDMLMNIIGACIVVGITTYLWNRKKEM